MFLAEMMHHLLELIQNGHQSIVFISMGLYYRHHSNNGYCCFGNITYSMESCSWWNILFILVVHTSQYPSLVWKIWNGLSSVSHVPYFWFNSTCYYWIWPCTSVYKYDVNSVKFLKEFLIRYSISFCFYSRLFWWWRWPTVPQNTLCALNVFSTFI